MKHEIELEMTVEEIEGIFNRPAQSVQKQAMKHSTWRIYKRLSANQRHVIATCKRSLIHHFGGAEAGRYISYRETMDARANQYWLRYQIERSAYAEDYGLLMQAQRWLEKNPMQDAS